MKNVELTVIDIFSGVGGMSLGFARKKSFRIVGAVDNDPHATYAYAKNLGVVPITGDVRQISARKILRRAGLRKGECTVLIGCAPCQSFSAHRRGRKKNAIDAIRNSLPFVWLALVKGIRPRHICFENVPGLVKASRGRIFRQFLSELADLGYKVAWAVEDAADYGIPQHRKRLLVVGSRVAAPRLPHATHAAPTSEAVRRGELRPWRTVRDAISDLPTLDSGEVDILDEYHAARNQEAIVLERLRYIGEGQSHRDLPPRLRLKCHKNQKGYPDVYGRMRWDAPSPTLTGGCTNLTKGRFAHPAQDRSITLREAMCLQTFPRKTVLRGTRDRMQLQVGNAVPPLLARQIADVVLQMEKAALATASSARRRTRS
jgi:DNA (cytosine-5)-methyltransferase 1